MAAKKPEQFSGESPAEKKFFTQGDADTKFAEQWERASNPPEKANLKKKSAEARALEALDAPPTAEEVAEGKREAQRLEGEGGPIPTDSQMEQDFFDTSKSRKEMLAREAAVEASRPADHEAKKAEHLKIAEEEEQAMTQAERDAKADEWLEAQDEDNQPGLLRQWFGQLFGKKKEKAEPRFSQEMHAEAGKMGEKLNPEEKAQMETMLEFVNEGQMGEAVVAAAESAQGSTRLKELLEKTDVLKLTTGIDDLNLAPLVKALQENPGTRETFKTQFDQLVNSEPTQAITLFMQAHEKGTGDPFYEVLPDDFPQQILERYVKVEAIADLRGQAREDVQKELKAFWGMFRGGKFEDALEYVQKANDEEDSPQALKDYLSNDKLHTILGDLYTQQALAKQTGSQDKEVKAA